VEKSVWLLLETSTIGHTLEKILPKPVWSQSEAVKIFKQDAIKLCPVWNEFFSCWRHNCDWVWQMLSRVMTAIWADNVEGVSWGRSKTIKLNDVLKKTHGFRVSRDLKGFQ